MLFLTVGAVVFGLMLVEARRAARNERAQRLRGGIEPQGDVYKVMRVAYPGVFLVMLVEGAMRGGSGAGAFAAGVLLFGCAKAVKWWAIAALGPFWTFRVIVVPGMKLVSNGPYRWIRHPNYVGVAGELIAVALMTGAAVTGPVMTAMFGGLLAKRIALESRMLRAAQTSGLSSNWEERNGGGPVPGLHSPLPDLTDHRKRSGNV